MEQGKGGDVEGAVFAIGVAQENGEVCGTRIILEMDGSVA